MKKYRILVAVFSAALFVSGFAACGGGLHTHTWSLTERVNATCEKSGGSIYQCECGEKYVREISALGHDWQATDGDIYTCERCGKRQIDDDSAEVPVESSSSSVEESVDNSSDNAENSVESVSSSVDGFVDSSSSHVDNLVDNSSIGAEDPVDSSSSSAEESVDNSTSSTDSSVDHASDSAEDSVESSSGKVDDPVDTSSNSVEKDPFDTPVDEPIKDSSDASTEDTPSEQPLRLETGVLMYQENKTKNGYVCIGAENSATMQELIIPAMYKDKPVTEISEGAFMDCKRLLCVHLGENLTKIGNNAFSGCSNIAEVHNYYDLRLEAYWDDERYCNSCILNSDPIVYTEPSEHGFVCDKDGFIMSATEDGRRLIGYVGESKDWVLPAEIVEVNRDVFGLCEGLRSVTFGDAICEVTTYMFCGCTSLERVTFGKGLERIAANAFKDCTKLKEAIFSETRIWITLCKDGNAEKEGECFDEKTLTNSVYIAQKLLELQDQRWTVVEE